MHGREIDHILEENEALLADGFDDALIGVVSVFNRGPVALYDEEKCLEILMERDGMSYSEAEEYFHFNVIGAWVGEKTPAFAQLKEDA